MAEDSLTFPHDPLEKGEIRLLQILPDSDSPLRCSIYLYDVSDFPEYTCLSYMWRRTPNDTDQCLIYVNDHPHWIGQSLADFLHVAQRKYPDVYFWIDALCIDQTNFDERSAQVREMGHIYSNATRTVAWLGLSDGAENLQFHNQCWRPRVMRQKSTGMTPQEAAIFNQIVKHNYWQRTWIVQEQRFSRNMEILVGETKISAERLIELNDFASRLVRLHGRDRSQVLPFKPATKSLLLGDRTKKVRMVELLKLYHKTSCLDVRDKIHALLAMAVEGADIEIDYTTTHIDLSLRTIWACRETFCMCLPSMLFRTLGIERVEEELQLLPHPFIEIIVGCYRCEEIESSQKVLKTCNCKDQDFLPDGTTASQRGIILCLKAICGFKIGAHLFLGNERVIYWDNDYPTTTLKWPPLVNVRYAKEDRFEMAVSLSFTPVGLFEFTQASIARMAHWERVMSDSEDIGDMCQKSAKNVFYRVLGHGLCSEEPAT